MDGRKSGVAREPENLHEPDADLHDATVDGNAEKAERAFEGEFFGRGCRRLAQNIFLEVAHHDHKANDDSENCLKQFVADAH